MDPLSNSEMVDENAADSILLYDQLIQTGFREI